jgi:hypothetical protein
MPMIRRYDLASYHVDSAGGGETTICYALLFDDHGDMLVEEHRRYEPFQQDSLSLIRPAQFDNYTIAGVSLRQLVLKKLQEILPDGD